MENPVALNQITKGTRGTIVSIYTDDERRLRKLLAMGIYPGAQIELLQRFPSFIISVGNTQIALDSDIAAEIKLIPSPARPRRRRKRWRISFSWLNMQ